MSETNKKNEQVRIGKGLFFSIIYACGTIVACLISAIFKEVIIKIFADHGWTFSIDKVAILGINSAISVCVVTTLTLALSIEGSAKSFKFGLSPKRLNEYLNYPISLPCSFVALGIQFVFSIAMIRAGNAPLFYTFTIASLSYFISLILKGLPVLSGNHKSTYKRIIETLTTGSKKEIKDDYMILKFLYSNGETFDSVFKSLNEKSTIDKPVEIKKSLLGALNSYIEESTGATNYLLPQWNSIVNTISGIALNRKYENCLDCKEEWFYCIYSFYSKQGYSKRVIDLLCSATFGISVAQTMENENASFIEYEFLYFVSHLFQNGDFDSLDAVKRSICKNTHGVFRNKKQRLYFFIVSFLLYSYCFDKKVPVSFKDKILSLKESSGGEIRFENKSWSSMFAKMVYSNFDISKDEFIRLIEEYGFFAEFFSTVDNLCVVTREKALIWYWTYLLISNQNENIECFIDKNNDEDDYYLKVFFNNIRTGKTEENERMIRFFFQYNYMGKFLHFDDGLEQKMIDYLNSKSQIILENNIRGNDVEKNHLITECINKLTNDLSSIQINGNNARSRRSSQTFHQIYKRTFDEKINLEVISHNVTQSLKATIHTLMNPTLLKKSMQTFESLFLSKCKRKKMLFANKRFEHCFNNGFFPKSWTTFAQKACKVGFSLYNNPFYFVSRLPYIGNFKVDVKIVPFSPKEISELKKEYDDGSGLICFEDVYYRDNEFQNAVNNCFYNLLITISYEYSFSRSTILEIELFS